MANDEDTCIDSPHKDGSVLDGAVGGIDDAGIATMSVRFLATTSATLLLVGAGTYLGLHPVSRKWAALNDGTSGYVVTIEFKGHVDGQEPDKGNEEVFSEQWGMDFDYSEEPIEAHPRLAELIKKYGGVKIAAPNKGYDFPLALPKGAKSSKGLGSSAKNGEADKNPVYGMTTYPLMQAVITRSFSCKKLPPEIVRNAGKSSRRVKGAPAEFDDLTPNDRDWMQMAPKIRQEGVVWRVEQSWKLSPPGGWVEIVHDVIDA